LSLTIVVLSDCARLPLIGTEAMLAV